MKTTTQKIGNYTYTFETDEERITEKCTRKFKASKIVYYYRYSSIEKLNEYREKFIQGRIQREERMKQNKESAKLRRKEEVKKQKEAYKVWAIFVNSWGYDQTNVDAYQIIETDGIKVRFKPIALETVPGSEGRDCCNVKPIPNAIIEASWKLEEGKEYFEKQLRGQYSFFPYGSQEIWDGKRSYYKSWYA